MSEPRSTSPDAHITDGKTKREAIHCLKRYIARDIHQLIVPIVATEQALDTA